MRTLRLLVGLMLALSLAPATQAGTATAKPGTATPAARVGDWGPPPPVTVIGDSITHLAAPRLAARQPEWLIDAVPGRRVTALNPVLTGYRARYGQMPSTLVLALGTNEWQATRRMYLRQLRRMPRSSTVVLVTTYRDPALLHPRRDRNMRRITRWMRLIAATRPNTCLAPWRPMVARRPWLLYDGTHPSERGQELWARLVEHRVQQCEAARSTPVTRRPRPARR